MDIATQEQRLGISVLIYTPAAIGTPKFIARIDDRLSAYSHDISAIGGYASASIALLSDINDLEFWLKDGLGCHVEVYNTYGQQIWEGFVNMVSLITGGFSIERGPLVDIVNRVSVEYTPIIDPDSSTPTTGTQTETVIAEDAASQAKYGIIERIVSGGTLLDDGITNDAEYVRDAFLEENREARSSHEISLTPGDGGEIILNLECRGYMDWLDLYVYNDVLSFPIGASTSSSPSSSPSASWSPSRSVSRSVSRSQSPSSSPSSSASRSASFSISASVSRSASPSRSPSSSRSPSVSPSQSPSASLSPSPVYYDFSIWVSDKIINTLEADPNAIFSTDYSGITANPLLISGTEDQNRTASVVIKECLSLGDIDSNRYLFGFYNGRRAVYSAIPTDTEYHYYRYSKN